MNLFRRATPRRPGWRRILQAERLESRELPALFLVTSLADAGAGSLREAIGLANLDPVPDTIRFAPSLHNQTLSLNSAGDTPIGPSALRIDTPITIAGDGEIVTRASTAAAFRLFFVSTTGSLSLLDLTLSNGYARGGNGGDGAGGGGGAGGLGGGFYIQGTLALFRCTLTGNLAQGGNGGQGGTGPNGSGGGGGLNGDGAPALGDVGGNGGGPNGGQGGRPTVDAGVGGPGGGGGGGGKGSYGGDGGFGGGNGGGSSGRTDWTLFGGNGGYYGHKGGSGGVGAGGAVFSDHGTVHLENCTLANNTAQGGNAGNVGTSDAGFGGPGEGDAIFSNYGALTMTYCTVARNTAAVGAGGQNTSSGGALFCFQATADLFNSILAYSTGGWDVAASYTTVWARTRCIIMQGHGNVFGDWQSKDPELGLLADNGGPTKTMALLLGSPALNAARNDGLVNPPGTDQRGAVRLAAGDLGAYEEATLFADPGVPLDLYVQRPNPDGPTAYIRSLYQAILGRSCGDDEARAWVALLNAGVPRQQIVDYFWNSTEHRWQQVDVFYQTVLHRDADPVGRAFWIAQLQAGVPEIAVLQALFTSPEYAALYSSAQGFLNGLYFVVLQARTPDDASLSAWLALMNGGLSRSDVAACFLKSPEADLSLILAAYAHYFHRAPDPISVRVWLGALTSGGWTYAGLAEAFLASDEFWNAAQGQVP